VVEFGGGSERRGGTAPSVGCSIGYSDCFIEQGGALSTSTGRAPDHPKEITTWASDTAYRMAPSRPNIVWITLDSVRADHTSVHGYRRDTTPELAALADRTDSVAFEQCIAHSTRTPVSVPSMLTGTYPSHHRVGIGSGGCGKVPASMATVPELLSDCGYDTAAVSRNAYAGEATGLDRGFDEFVTPTFAADLLDFPHVASLLKYGLAAHRHSGGLTTDKQRHPKSFLVTDVARRLLTRRRSDQPLFLYLHYNDPHRPYFPPRSYRGRYVDDADWDIDEALSFAADMHENAYEYMANGLPFSDVQWEMLHAMYDATIAYTDACLGPIVEYVQERMENTMLVVTADHGELFGERGLLGHHIVLADAVTHVPLVISGLSELDRVRDDPVQHIDVMETLVALAGGDTSQFQGYDLRTERREFAVSQDLRETVEDPNKCDYARFKQHNPDFDADGFHRSFLTALRTTDFKYLTTDEWTRLYEFPDETTDVSETHPDVAADFEAAAREFLANEGQPFVEAPGQTDHPEHVEDHLRKMGYLQ